MTDASHVSPTYAGEPPQPCDDFPACVSFDAHGLVPVVVQQEGTGEVLMVAWANREALDLTIKTRTSWFWSRSQQVRRILVDCDADTLIYVVDSPGPACHTGHRSCFFREVPLA